jgi:hypothetical protein
VGVCHKVKNGGTIPTLLHSLHLVVFIY